MELQLGLCGTALALLNYAINKGAEALTDPNANIIAVLEVDWWFTHKTNSFRSA